jgi:hypothetical protein
VSSIRNVNFYVLICVVSLALQSTISFNIYNLCRTINLISPVYFIHGGKWNVVPDQKIDVSAVMKNCLEFDAGQNILEGALAYKIQRKHAKSTQDESKRTWLLAAWNGEYTKGLHVCALLVEHSKRLDEDRLKKLCQKRWPLLKTQTNTIKSDWTLNSTTMLTTTVKVKNGGYRWEIFITEKRK